MNEYEIIPNPKIKHLHCFVNKIVYRNFHTHNHFEIVLILQGEGTINVNNHTYSVKKDDIFMMNPNEPHEISGGVICCILQLSRQFCSSYCQSLKNTRFNTEYINLLTTQEDITRMKHLIKNITFHYVEKKQYFEIVCIQQTLELLYLLLQTVPHTVMNASEYSNYSKKISRLNRISTYIDMHYHEPLRLETIAKEEQITITHLSHLFRTYFGITFQEYLNNKRFEQAVILIEREDINLTQVSEFSGFSDLKYLNKIFQKKIGMSPREFRNSKNKITTMEDTPKTFLEHKYNSEESIFWLTNSIE